MKKKAVFSRRWDMCQRCFMQRPVRRLGKYKTNKCEACMKANRQGFFSWLDTHEDSPSLDDVQRRER